MEACEGRYLVDLVIARNELPSIVAGEGKELLGSCYTRAFRICSMIANEFEVC
jgi:hypothetical protein